MFEKYFCFGEIIVFWVYLVIFFIFCDDIFIEFIIGVI